LPSENQESESSKAIERPIQLVGIPPPEDEQQSTRLSVAEIVQYERTETGKHQLARFQAQTALVEAETKLREVQRGQAKDDRMLRLVAAGISVLGVAVWTWWMCDFIVRCSIPGKTHYEASERVQIALIANTGVAMIGLFAIVLRGLFRVPGDEGKTNSKDSKD